MNNLAKNQKKIWEAENIFYLKSDTSRISKLIYQYELYKLIRDVPGAVLEFGVFKGASFIRFLTFRSILENNYSRKFYGFDLFGKFPRQKQNNHDLKFIKIFEKEAGLAISHLELEKNLIKKNFTNFDLIQGDVRKTLPKFIEKNPNLKIALLHLDLDTYKITQFVLKKLFNNLSSRGIVVVDDYSSNYGATKAIDEFLLKNKKYQIKKLPFYDKPSYIVKI
jgi:hypothetical protein